MLSYFNKFIIKEQHHPCTKDYFYLYLFFSNVATIRTITIKVHLKKHLKIIYLCFIIFIICYDFFSIIPSNVFKNNTYVDSRALENAIIPGEQHAGEQPHSHSADHVINVTLLLPL